jgi:IS30 family transposase
MIGRGRLADARREAGMPGRRLTIEEREDIAYLVGLRMGVREIAARLRRSPATVSRELRRGLSPSPLRYRPFQAQMLAVARSQRSRPRKLAAGSALRGQVAVLLAEGWSPGQIAGRLKRDHPGRRELQVSHETIYQALYVQGKGSLRAEISTAIRCGRTRRRQPRSRADETRGKIPGMINISERPAEAADRAVPGHWEGDLIIGGARQSAVVTLAERTTRFCMIIALPEGRTADKVADAVAAHMTTLPAALRRSLAWDQGKEMSGHAAFTVATGIPVYFADPHSPWQRGTNENTNGLIRYYLPKGTDLAGITQRQLDHIARQLNTRPRRVLHYATPAEALNDYLVAAPT